MKTYRTAYPFFPKKDIKKILKKTKKILLGEKMLTMSEYVDKFEKNFSQYIGTKYAVATNSCTSALEIVLHSLNLNSDDEVIVPVQTFTATGSSVLKSGAKIVFCDCDDNLLLDFKSLKKRITKNTKAVIIVHFAGLISKDIVKIKQYLSKKDIFLIEDAAHAHGAIFKGLKAGNIGDFGCFSFYSTKIMTTGEGGMITLNSKKHFEICSSLRNRGLDINRPDELFINLGSNHRFTEFQALLGIYQLKRLKQFSKYRNKIASIYKKELKELIENGTIRLQEPSKNSKHAYWRFIVFLNKHKRDEIKNRLNKIGIKADAPYSPLLHEQPIFQSCEKDDYPNAAKLSNTHISLPLHVKITKKDAIFIAKKLKKELSCKN